MSDKIINTRERVKLFATDKHKYITAGKEFEVHPIHAKRLIEQGKATKTKGKTKE